MCIVHCLDVFNVYHTFTVFPYLSCLRNPPCTCARGCFTSILTRGDSARSGATFFWERFVFERGDTRFVPAVHHHRSELFAASLPWNYLG